MREVVEDHRASRQRIDAQPGHRELGRPAGLHGIEIHADRADAIAGVRTIHPQGARRQIVPMRPVLLAGQIAQNSELLGVGQIDARCRGHAQLRQPQRGAFDQRVETRLAAGAHGQGVGHAGERVGGLRIVQMRARAGDQQPAFVGGKQTVDHRHPRLCTQYARRRRRQHLFDQQLPRRSISRHRRRQREVGQSLRTIGHELRPQIFSGLRLRFAAFAVRQTLRHQHCGNGAAAAGGALQ